MCSRIMSMFQGNISINVSFFMLIGIIGMARGISSYHKIHRNIDKFAAKSNIHVVVVDQSGNGDFLTIQSAIDSVPSNNYNWICIYIKAGTYNEQVNIPIDKPMIYLRGEGRSTTNVVFSESEIATGATFHAQADNILVTDLSFTNSYNYPPNRNKNPINPATAALIEGDKNVFYNCGFYGFQDTLWDATGRHYFHGCYIEGAIDFIMGSAQSMYEECNIYVITKVLNGWIGYITAQSRGSPNEGSGFVFKHCTVDGDGPAYLGRPWRKYARVLFYQCNISSIIDPQGWDTWDGNPNHARLSTFAEYNCTGPGSNTNSRVKWEKQLSGQDLLALTSLSFIDNEGWMAQLHNILPS